MRATRFKGHGPMTGFLFFSDFLKSRIDWTIMLILSHVLFWIWGFPVLRDYGYSNRINPTVGNIPSGPQGSGIVVITLAVVIILTMTWLEKLWAHEVGKAQDIGLSDEDDNDDEE